MASDQFDKAQQAINAQKAALQVATATYGSEAAARMKEAADTVTAQRQSAIAGALAELARGGGAPAAAQAGAQTTLSAPYDRRLADISQAGASRGAGIAQSGLAGQNYLSEAAASVPALRTALAGKEALGRARIEAALAKERATSSKSSAAADRQAALDVAPGTVLSRLGGLDAVMAQIASVGPQDQGRYALSQGRDPVGIALAAAQRSPEDMTGESNRSFADLIGQGLTDPLGNSLPAGYIASVLKSPTYQAKQQTAQDKIAVGPGEAEAADFSSMTYRPAETKSLHKTNYYKEILGKAKEGLSNGATFDEIRRVLATQYGARYPRSVGLVLKELGGIAPRTTPTTAY